MNTPIDSLIAGENAKLDLLRSKIVECERRIAVLEAMKSEGDDLDAALTRKVNSAPRATGIFSGSPPAAPTPVDPVKSNGGFPKKSLGESALKMLRFAGDSEKSVSEFLDFAAGNGINKDRHGIRAFLHQYKATYKLLSSERDGHFRLSPLGRDYLASLHAGGATSAR